MPARLRRKSTYPHTQVVMLGHEEWDELVKTGINRHPFNNEMPHLSTCCDFAELRQASPLSLNLVYPSWFPPRSLNQLISGETWTEMAVLHEQKVLDRASFAGFTHMHWPIA